MFKTKELYYYFTSLWSPTVNTSLLLTTESIESIESARKISREKEQSIL